MTKISDTLWGYAIDESWDTAHVIFSNNGSDQSDSGAGHEINKGESKILQNGGWNNYAKPVTPTAAPQPTTAKPTTPAPSGSGIYGDVNSDNIISVKDATAIQKHIAKLNVLTGNNLAKADVNSDNVIIISLFRLYSISNKFISGFSFRIFSFRINHKNIRNFYKNTMRL